MSKLDIRTQPERFSAFERAISAHNMICQEFGFTTWIIGLPAKRETEFLGMNWITGGGHGGAYVTRFDSKLEGGK